MLEEAVPESPVTDGLADHARRYAGRARRARTVGVAGLVAVLAAGGVVASGAFRDHVVGPLRASPVVRHGLAGPAVGAAVGCPAAERDVCARSWCALTAATPRPGWARCRRTSRCPGRWGWTFCASTRAGSRDPVPGCPPGRPTGCWSEGSTAGWRHTTTSGWRATAGPPWTGTSSPWATSCRRSGAPPRCDPFLPCPSVLSETLTSGQRPGREPAEGHHGQPGDGLLPPGPRPG